MPIEKILVTKKQDLTPRHQNAHPVYEFHSYDVVPRHTGTKSAVAFFDIAPGKSNFPFHWHDDSEEIFYIISGEGTLETNGGDIPVSAGTVIFCPAGAEGAHKLTNTSSFEPLCYIDIDTLPKTDLCVYPKTGKIGVYTKSNAGGVFKSDNSVGYYDGE